MGAPEMKELQDNAEAWAQQITRVAPQDIGALVVFVNLRTGEASMRAARMPASALKDLLRTMLSRLDGDSGLIVPAGILPKNGSLS